ncbi:MAG TPA: DUF6152 family protein [Thermoanaerobaculia bacterium]|nr:DUF6152 family protein [Thermoanaerobaculia bacterium]
MTQTRSSRARHVLVLAWSAFWIAATFLLAHHGWTDYDETRTLNLTGVIQESSYESPHGTIRLKVSGENPATWHCILAPPSRMTRRGLSAEMLKVGATATVVGYPHRKDAGEMRTERITVEGKTVELR